MLRRRVQIVRNLNSVSNRQSFCSMKTRIQKRQKVRRRRVELLFVVFDGWLPRPRQREVMMMTRTMMKQRRKVDVIHSHVHWSLLMGGSYVGFRWWGSLLQIG